MKMNTVTFLGSRASNGKNDITVMAAAYQKTHSNTRVKLVYLEDLLIEISGDVQSIRTQNDEDLKDTDLVLAFNWYKPASAGLYRDLAYSIGLYLDANNVPIWNSEISMQRSTTKLSAMMQLALNKLPVPHTLFSLDPSLLIASTETLGNTMIAKKANASRGASNYLVSSSEELEKILNAPTNSYILQEFIPNDSDLRVVCFNGEPALAMKRSRKDNTTHLNNTSKGGEAELVNLAEIDAKILTECRKISKIMGREMAGIDIMYSSNNPSRYVFLEVNAIPQLTSGSFVDEKMQKLTQSINQFLNEV